MATLFYQTKNNAKTTITNNPLTAGGLSITLASSTGSKFPTTGNTWLGTIWDAVTYPDPSDDPNMEIVLIDSRSTDTLTVNASGRGFAGTTGVSHATGSAFQLLFTKEHADQWNTAINTLEARPDVGTYTAGTAFTPTWAASGTQPAIGNGSITGRYTQIGKLVWCNINLSIGSTTTFGTGEWTLSLPITAQGSSSVGSARALDSGVGYYNGVATLVSATTLSIYTNGASVGWSVTGPMTWATNDTAIITFVYEAA